MRWAAVAVFAGACVAYRLVPAWCELAGHDSAWLGEVRVCRRCGRTVEAAVPKPVWASHLTDSEAYRT